jgi:ribosomal protein L13E
MELLLKSAQRTWENMSEKAAKKASAGKASARKTATKKAPLAAEPEVPREVLERKAVPAPTVLARHESEMHERAARGYSLGELKSVEMGLNTAKRSGVPLDLRRRSVLDGNVAKLKGWYVPEPRKAPVESEGTTEKVKKPRKKAAKKPGKTTRAKTG